MNIEKIPLDQIDVGERLRQIDPHFAAMIAESMEQRGQDTPVDVRHQKGGRYLLVTGGHRYAAATLLGWTEIKAKQFKGSADDAELLQIDENLCRRELSALDRATFLARRKEIYDERHGKKHGGDRRSDQVANFANWSARFTQDVAERVGMSERAVQLAISRYQKIAPDVRARLASTPFAAKGSELDALAKVSHEEQRQILDLLLHAVQPRGSVKEARDEVRGVRHPERTRTDEHYRSLLAAFAKYNDRQARKLFLDYLVSSGALDAARPRKEAKA